MFTKELNRYSRLSAALIHAGISLVIFLTLFLVLIYVWYPAPYFSASGGWQGIKIVALVDIVLGPLLTFCVFNKNKAVKLLVMDLSIIFILQFAALSYGIYTVYQQQPAAIVFWENRFYTVPYQIYRQQKYDIQKLTAFSSQKPPQIFAEKPKSAEELKTLMQENKQELVNHTWIPFHQTNLYRPFQQHLPDAFEHQIDIEEIIDNNQDMKQQLDSILIEHNGLVKDYYYLRLESRYRNIILVFNKAGDQIGYITAPFKAEQFT